MDNTFKFSFWNYLPLGVLNNKEIMDKWVDIGSNLFMSFKYINGVSKKEDMIDLLDNAKRLGKKVIVSDTRVEYLRLKEMSKEEFVKGVKQAVADWGWHEAVFGFYGGDEPFEDQEDNFCFTMSLLKKEMPNLAHYGNLLPYWSNLLPPDMENHDDDYYIKKTERLIKDGHLDILAFDQYTQCYDESKDQKKGILKFVKGMLEFSKLAKKYNIPLYISLLSIGHFNYREPSEHDIRWQINVSAALGAMGVVWFYFHQDSQDFKFFNPPFLGERALITPMYGKIQRSQYIFSERYQETFESINIDEISMLGDDALDGYKYCPDNKIIERIDIRDKDVPAILTFAHYKDDPKHKILMVTNLSQKSWNAYSVYFKNGEARHFDVCAGEIHIIDINKIVK